MKPVKDFSEDEVLTLIKLKIATMMPVSKRLLGELHVGLREDFIVNNIVIRMTETLWYQKKSKQIAKYSFEFPATTWDYLKDKYAPKWFLTRWPVKTMKIEKEAEYIEIEAYPEYKYHSDLGQIQAMMLKPEEVS